MLSVYHMDCRKCTFNGKKAFNYEPTKIRQIEALDHKGIMTFAICSWKFGRLHLNSKYFHNLRIENTLLLETAKI